MSSKIFDDDDLRGQIFTNVGIYKVCIGLLCL